MAFNNFKNRRGNAFPNANFKGGNGKNLDDLRPKPTVPINTGESTPPWEGASTKEPLNKNNPSMEDDRKSGVWEYWDYVYGTGEDTDWSQVPEERKQQIRQEFQQEGAGKAAFDQGTYEGAGNTGISEDDFYKIESEYMKSAKGKKYNDPELRTQQEKMAERAYEINCNQNDDVISYDDLGMWGNKRIQKLQENKPCI